MGLQLSFRPSVSVIIPVFNTAQYLRRCMDSICGQTLKDIEILCIDDGSCDGSIEILKEYAITDSRVCIVRLGHNQGVSVARNVGIEIAHGKWLGFVDSDDSIELDFYEKLYTAAASGRGEIIKGVRWSERNAPQYINWAFNEKIRNDKFYFTYEWTTAIYDADLIKNNSIYFIRGCTNSEDVAFLYQSVICANNIVIVDDAVYNYFLIDDSANTYYLSYAKIASLLNAIKFIINLINKYLYQDKVYIEQFVRWIQCCLQYIKRVKIEEKHYISRYIAASLIDIYKKCMKKKELIDYINMKDSDLAIIIKQNNVKLMAEYLLQDQKKRLFSKIRAQFTSELYKNKI